MLLANDLVQNAFQLKAIEDYGEVPKEEEKSTINMEKLTDLRTTEQYETLYIDVYSGKNNEMYLICIACEFLLSVLYQDSSAFRKMIYGICEEAEYKDFKIKINIPDFDKWFAMFSIELDLDQASQSSKVFKSSYAFGAWNERKAGRLFHNTPDFISSIIKKINLLENIEMQKGLKI